MTMKIKYEKSSNMFPAPPPSSLFDAVIVVGAGGAEGGSGHKFAAMMA